jgi:capsular exopolysaccharide synthesis family protein
MSKFYDALVKSQWKNEARKKGTTADDPAPEPHHVTPDTQDTEVERKRAFLFESSEVTSKKSTRKIEVAHEKITQVAVGNVVAREDSVMAEQFRKLRGILATQHLISPIHSLLVTSCLPGEGKTKVAINLSAIIARGLDDSVILVDGDLRKKSLTSQLGLQNTLGLSDVLAERANINETLIDTEIKGLMVLPAGFNPPNPAELMTSVRMRNLLEQLQERYNSSYILIDSTPIVSTSETSSLSQMVDAIIVVIMAEKTRRDVVKREIPELNSEKILGVVLNCAEFETSDYYHKSYKDYYHRGKD